MTSRRPDIEGAIGSAPYPRRRRLHRSAGKPRPRVLQLLATGSSGGAQESYTGLLLHIDRDRFDALAVSLSAGSAVRRLRGLGVEVDVIEEADDQAAVWALADRLRTQEIDLVHNHMYRADVVGTLAAREAGTPVVVSTVHSSRVRAAADVETLRRLSPWIARLIVPSEAIARKVRAEGRDVPVSVVPNGISLERFSSADLTGASVRAELGVAPGELLFGSIARLEPEKGHRYLLHAVPAVVRECPGAWFLIVGEGSLEAELRRHAASLPDRAGERIIFTGRRDDVVAVTAALDVAVLPSVREAQGISLLEAMALRKPIVASAVGGIPEVIDSGVQGVLVPARDGAALAEALLSLARDAVARRRMGEAGRRTVQERYSVGAMVRLVEAVYEEELLRAGVSGAVVAEPSAAQATPLPAASVRDSPA